MKKIRHATELLDMRSLAFITILVSFLWCLLFDLVLGYGILSSDSHHYMNHANGIRDSGFSYLLKEVPFYYWIVPLLIHGFQSLLPDGWALGFVVLQCFCYGIFCAFVLSISNQLFGRRSAFVSLLFCLLSYEFISWTRYILTDVFFATFVVGLIYSFLKLEDSNWKSFLYWSIVAVLCCLVLVARPIGFLIPGAFLLYVFFRYWRCWSKRVLIYTGGGVVVALVVVFALVLAVWDDYNLQRYLVGFGGLFDSGILIKDRPLYALPVQWFYADNPIFFRGLATFLLIVLRFFSFWNPLIVGYSIEHLVINFFTLLPVFCLVILGFRKIIGRQQLLLYWLIFVVTAFHSITLIDFDQRYRVPLLGIAFVLAGGYFSTNPKKGKIKDQADYSHTTYT